MGNSGSKTPPNNSQEQKIDNIIASGKKKSRKAKTFVDRYVDSQKKIDSGYEADIEDANSLENYNQKTELNELKQQHAQQIEDTNNKLHEMFSASPNGSQENLNKIQEEHAQQVEEANNNLFERFSKSSSNSIDSDKGRTR